jgi:hypothetical protein
LLNLRKWLGIEDDYEWEYVEFVKEDLMEMAGVDERKAISLMIRSTFVKMLRKHPDYVFHYNTEYWAKEIISENPRARRRDYQLN